MGAARERSSGRSALGSAAAGSSKQGQRGREEGKEKEEKEGGLRCGRHERLQKKKRTGWRCAGRVGVWECVRWRE